MSGYDWGSQWGGGSTVWGGGSSGSSSGGSIWSGGSGNFGDGSSSSGTGGNFWGSVLKGIGTYFGGSGSSGSGNSSAWWNAASGAASAYLGKEAMEEKGKQDRATTAFEAELMDYYKQKDKYRKRVALDTYGQFSTMKRWAPTATAAAPVDVPNKPSP